MDVGDTCIHPAPDDTTRFHSHTKRARQDRILLLIYYYLLILDFIPILGEGNLCNGFKMYQTLPDKLQKEKRKKDFLLKAHTHSGTMPLPESKHSHFIRQTHSNWSQSHFAYSVPLCKSLSCSMSFCSLLIPALNGACLMVKDQGF